MNWTDISQIAATVFAAIAAVASWRAIFDARSLKKDDELLAHCTVTLERAYSGLMGGDLVIQAPPISRLNWLNSARLIEDYLATKKEIRSSEILRRCDGHEEFWRHKFYLALSPLALDFGYYNRGEGEGNTIAKVSAVIVHAFATWPDNKLDPLDAYKDVDAAIKIHGLSWKWASLGRYLDRL